MAIIIVGAGFAGLAAAYTLQKAGYETLVLEARERVGGRVYSVTLKNGAPVELGGEWIEAHDQTLRNLATELGVALAPIGIDFALREVVGGRRVPMAEQEAMYRLAAEQLAQLTEVEVQQGTIGGFIDSLPLEEPQLTLLRSRWQSTWASDLSRTALRDLRGGFGLSESAHCFRVAEGNQTLAEALAARARPVRLQHRVETISQDGNGVMVRGEAAGEAFEIQGEALVLAVPLPLLAKLTFEPALPPELVAAIAAIPMGVAAKLAIGTGEPPEPRHMHDVSGPFSCYAGLGGDGQPRLALTAFAGSPQAQERLQTAAGPEAWLARLQAYNPEVTFTGSPQFHHWGLDPLAEGCYTAPSNRAYETLPLLSQPVGRITLAGEHLTGSGTMNGALESGQAAAKRVRRLLG